MENNFKTGETLWHKIREQYCLYINNGKFVSECLVQFADGKTELVKVNHLETTN